MPLKAGPHGTMRRYSSVTGRYVNEPGITIPPYQMSKREKRERRERLLKEELDNRARNSKDPLVHEVYGFLKECTPFIVKNVNEDIFVPTRNSTMEMDIVCDRAIIEVKSGKTLKCSSQCLRQKEYAESRNKKHILFAPNIKFNTKRDYENKGLTVAKTYKELLEELNK